MKFTEDRRKILKVATMYYTDGLTQAEIAEKIGISRPVISKLLREARELGIVEIYIKDENACSISLALNIETDFALKDVIVVPTTKEFSKSVIKKSVARAAASYITNQLTKVENLGLSWGTTIAEVIDEMPYLSYPNLTIHPLVGGVASRHLFLDANHLAFLLSEKLSANCRYLYAPALAESLALKKILETSILTTSVLQQAKNVDLALIGVGNPTNSSTWEDLAYIDSNELEKLQALHVVGDAVASFFDEKGQPLQTDLTERLMGVTIEELKQVKNVVAVATGSEKCGSIRALLLAGVIDTLVIDQEIAEGLCRDK
ncbi:sugar-binding transcriptional regulator [Carnobacterium gallinarum]|uniref:sugar-binding transcriptional regulator n=1 Tax=Carnobacterium gallinarum TaxID=2749 RepID=UPI000559530D|nr:sugar-binding transcriptional regulator [Carnobacterium gallinarum]